MQNQIKGRVNKVVIAILLMMAVACDTFQEDGIAPDKLVDFGQTEFYLLPGTSVVIDIMSIVDATFTNGTMTVSKSPIRGVLTELTASVLVYEPNATFTDGNDQFVISVTDNGNTIVNQTISLSMVNNEIGVSCPVFAVQDIRTVESDSPISIRYLENDRVCGAESANLLATIHVSPRHGQARLEDDVIIYTPDSGFNNFDTIVYKIRIREPSNANSENSLFGLIILRRTSCFMLVPQTVYLNLAYPGNEIMSSSECGEGFFIYEFSQDWRSCQNGTNFSVELITQSEISGKICYDTNEFFFIPDQAVEPQDENAKFQICVDAECTVLTIQVKRLKDFWTNRSRISDLQFVEDQAKTIFFVNENIGFAGGESIWKTLDGGLTWRVVFPWYTFGVLEINDIHFVDDSNGFAAYKNSFNGGVLKTVDGGEHWTRVESPSENTVSIHFISREIGFIGTTTGEFSDPTTQGRIYKTVDGGANWTVTRGGPKPVENIQFLDDAVGFANQGVQLLRSDDEGSTWKSLNLSDYPLALGNNGTQIFLKYDNTLWMSDGSNLFVKRPDDQGSYHNAIAFSPSGRLGIAVGVASGQVAEALISSDGGETWSTSNLEHLDYKGFELIDVSIPSENVAFALARRGYILKLNRR